MGDWSGTVVICAANNWDGARFQDRQLAERLCKLVPVLYVDPPMSLLSRWRRPELKDAFQGPRLRVIEPGLARLTPIVLPGMERMGISLSTRGLMARAIRRAIEQLGGDLWALIETSCLVPVIGRCGERLRVYWAQDDYVGAAELLGLSASRVRRGEQHVVSTADLVVAANPTIADALKQQGVPTELIPFGCDVEVFAAARTATPASDVELPRPIAGFMGHIGERIDLPLLEAVAASGNSLLLVGPRHPRFAIERMNALFDLPNVQWVGPKDFEALPSYLRLMDVGLVPYNDSAFNRGSFPLKTFEYLAAGLPVVATPLPAIQWIGSPFISVANTAEDFAAAVTRQLADTSTGSLRDERTAFATQHSWEVRAEAFAAALARGDTGDQPHSQ